MRLQSQWEFRPRWVVSFEKRLLGLLKPIDLLRRRLTRGLQVGAAAQEVRRGEEVEALVTISSARGLGDVEVGLLCTEYYACEGVGDSGGRAITYAIAHEAWLPVDCAPGVQSVRLTIPTEAHSRMRATASRSGGRSSPAGAGGGGSMPRRATRSRCSREHSVSARARPRALHAWGHDQGACPCPRGRRVAFP
jgi:hypothetical protein